MQDEANIRFVDTEAESFGRDHHRYFILHESLLGLFAFRLFHFGVITSCSYTLANKVLHSASAWRTVGT